MVGGGTGRNINLEEGNDTGRILFLLIYFSYQRTGPSQHHVRYYNSDINLQFYCQEDPEDKVRDATS